MADNIVTANPGAGGALFAVDLDNGTSTPYMKIATSNPVEVQGTVGVSGTVSISGTVSASGIVSTFPLGTQPISAAGVVSTFAVNATGGQISSFPIGTTMVNIVSTIPLPFTPTGTSYITIASTQVAIGGGTQYASGAVTTVPTGTMNLWASGAGNSTMTAVASSAPMPVYAISTAPHTITGTTQVNIVSSVALGFTPTGTSMVNVVSSNLLAPLNQISSNIYTDGAAWAEGSGKLAVVGGYYSSTAPSLAHSSTGALLLNASSMAVIAPGAAEVMVSTQPAVAVMVTDANGNQVANFGSGTQYVNNAATTQPTGMVGMWASGAGNSTMVAVASSRPLPMNIVSSIALGFTPTGTSFVTISSTQVGFAVTGQVSTFANNVSSTFITGSVNQSTTPIPASQGGLDVIWYPSVTTAPRTIKNSAGRLYDIWFSNNATSARYLKLYNASSASVSTGTTVPLMAFGLPAMTTSYTVMTAGWLGSAMGYQFSTAIAVAVTASNQTSSDTSAPGTNEVNLMFGYR